MSNATEERFLIDRGTDAKRASRTSWGEDSYVKVASTLSNNAYSDFLRSSPKERTSIWHVGSASKLVRGSHVLEY
jgi:hypothetical protein